MRYKYKVRELGPEQLGIQNEEYVEVGESKDMEAMSLKKLKAKLDHKKEYHIESVSYAHLTLPTICSV